MRVVLILTGLSIASIGFSQTNDCDSPEKCSEALKGNQRSSLLHFRKGEIFFRAKKYVSAANEFRMSLNGDLTPKWVEVWSHVNLGKIFDTTGQRERALNEYRLAKRTGDNTRGAQDEVAIYTEQPYKSE